MRLLGKKRKGNGTLVAFSCAIIVLLMLLFLFISAGLHYNSVRFMEYYSEKIARAAIVCESMEDAQRIAQELAVIYIGGDKYIDEESVQTFVYYPPGHTQEWEKGNMVCISITAFVESADPFTSKFETCREYYMIERSE